MDDMIQEFEPKKPQKSKYESYIPSEEERECLKELVDLDQLTQMSSEMVPNVFTGAIGTLQLHIIFSRV